MALIETLEQLREAYNAIAGSAEGADKAADRMEEHERRTAALLARLERVSRHRPRFTPRRRGCPRARTR
ncbi:MAG: hypothetical protein OXH32_03805 [Acidobacteria bacterium]|nr:hypothetical protein [Acidobacteriota bacterium]MXZ37993.1 hypothetical protein [Holophagales bacterium]